MSAFVPSRQMRADTVRWEGKSYKVYPDSRGNPTNGIGHHNGVSFGDPDVDDATIERNFDSDIQGAYAGALQLFPDLDALDLVRREVLIGIVFNMGHDKVAIFAPFVHYVNVRNWDSAAYHLETNLSHHLTPYLVQVGARAVECALRIATGNILDEFKISGSAT